LSLQNSNFSPASAGTLFNINFGATTGNTYAEMGVTSGGGLVFDNLVLQGGGGRLLVGATSAIGGEAVTIQGRNAAGNEYCLFTQADTAGTAYALRTYSTTAAAVVGSITFTSSATAYNTSSDYRLKNTIAPMTGALAKVALLKPCTYKWNFDGSDGQGFIAHELAEVCPDAVTGTKDAVDEEGKPQYQGIDTSFLVATLTAAIQEQQAIIQTLTARVAALEAA
jgi:hypothetical protein